MINEKIQKVRIHTKRWALEWFRIDLRHSQGSARVDEEVCLVIHFNKILS